MAAGDTAELPTGELLPCGFLGTDAVGEKLAVPRRYRSLARACKRVKCARLSPGQRRAQSRSALDSIEKKGSLGYIGTRKRSGNVSEAVRGSRDGPFGVVVVKYSTPLVERMALGPSRMVDVSRSRGLRISLV